MIHDASSAGALSILPCCRLAHIWPVQQIIQCDLSLSGPPPISSSCQRSEDHTAVQAEAPAVFMPGKDSIFIIGSHLTGWDANPALLLHAQAPSLCEAQHWEQSAPGRGPGSQTTFQSQAAAVFPYEYEDGTVLFVYMGDRWNAYGPGSVLAPAPFPLPLIVTLA